MWFGDEKRVTLKDDLTRYHPHLRVGVRGTLLSGVKVGEWGSLDHFGAVKFDCCGTTLDVVPRGLDIEGKAEEDASRETQFREDLKTTTEAVLTVGPRGGFRHLSIAYNRGGLGIGF